MGRIVLYEQKGRKMVILGSKVNDDQKEGMELRLREFGYENITEEGVYFFAQEHETLWQRLTEETALTHVQDLGEDRRASINRSGNGRKLILTSPNNDQLSQLHSEARMLRLYMPRWELDELLQAGERCYPKTTNQDDIKERFELYGGIVRFVLEFSKEECERAMTKAFNNLRLDDLTAIFHANRFEAIPSQKTTDMFIHIVPVIYDMMEGFPNKCHSVQNWTLCLASI